MIVVSNTAVSLDGRINTKEGGFVSLGSGRDHARMSRLRGEADAVLVGGATFRNWPHPALAGDADRTAASRRPWNVVVSRSMKLPLATAFIDEPRIRPLVMTRAAAVPASAGVEIAAYDGPGDDLPVPWMLEQLRGRGVERLLIEAGGDLLFQFLAADAVDELFVTLCPWVIGGPAPTLADGAGFDASGVRRLALLSADIEGDEVFLHYRARRGESGLGR